MRRFPEKPDETFLRFQRQLERFLYQDRAELAAVRAILRSVLAAMVAQNPRNPDILALLKQIALSQFEMPSQNEGINQDQKRMRELSRNEVEEFFEVFDLASSQETPKSGGPH